MPDGKPGGVGGKLRDARERRGATIRAIADATKISPGALEALERNDIARLPGGIFSRAFVRAYALEVGLDAEETIREFIAQFPSDTVTAGHPTTRRLDDEDEVDSNRRAAVTVVRLAAVSIPLMIAVLYFGGRGPQPKSASTDPLPEVLSVAVSATGPAWITLTADGEPVVDRQFRLGEREIVDVRRELVLRTDNGGAVAMTIDGVPAKALGPPGEPRTLRVGPKNYREFLAAR